VYYGIMLTLLTNKLIKREEDCGQKGLMLLRNWSRKKFWEAWHKYHHITHASAFITPTTSVLYKEAAQEVLKCGCLPSYKIHSYLHYKA